MPKTGTQQDVEALRKTVEQRAYALWEAEGKPDGRDADHWRQAESEIMAAGEPREKSDPPGAAGSPGNNKAKSVDSNG
ncbi:MAG: DUF2934 domain-containing protein [Rhodobacteraceae bacterium]|nr:DUF2934 domain-containing protein [Paracoccaceae bacterium]